MDKLSPQLTLGLGLRDEATFANYIPGKNIEIVNYLKDTAAGNVRQSIYLCGIGGGGVSHLLQATCHYAHQMEQTSVYLPLAQIESLTPDVLQGMETLSIVCIDDLHLVAGKERWEEAIFYLYNRIRDQGGSIIIAGRGLPKDIGIKLPDLVSRLTWGIVFQLSTLSDNDKLEVLMLRAKCRGMTLSEESGRYILTHCPRHTGTLMAALDALDSASLAAQRRLTIPFIKEVLQI